MKFCRIVERGNRQVLITVGKEEDGDSYTLTFETQYQGESLMFIEVAGFKSYADASKAMEESDEDEVIRGMAEVLDDISEGK